MTPAQAQGLGAEWARTVKTRRDIGPDAATIAARLLRASERMARTLRRWK